MTGTSLKSPMSGTSIVCAAVLIRWSASAPRGRSRTFSIASATTAGSITPVRGELAQRGDRHVVAVDLEEPPQRAPRSRCARSRRCRAPGSGPAPTGGSDRRTRGCSRSRRPPARGARRGTRRRTPARLGERVQHVPALDLDPVAAQLGERGHAPDVGVRRRSRTPAARPRPAPRAGSSPTRAAAPAASRTVEAPRAAGTCRAGSPRAAPSGIAGWSVVLVHQRDVVEDVLLLDDHPPQAVLDDHRDLVGERRVVGATVGDDREQHVAVAVLVLQPLAVERRPPGGAAEQEAARAAVAGRPHEVADPLVAEHRVVDVERDHLHAVGAVRGPGGDERRDRAGLGDPLLEDLAVLVLLVEHQLLGVLGLVELADRRVDPDLAEHPLHPERPRLVGDDRDDVAAQLLVAQQRREHPDERHRGRDLALAGALELALEDLERRDLELRGRPPADRQHAAELGSALAQVAASRASRRAACSTRRRAPARRSAAARSGRGTPAARPRSSSWPGG